MGIGRRTEDGGNTAQHGWFNEPVASVSRIASQSGERKRGEIGRERERMFRLRASVRSIGMWAYLLAEQCGLLPQVDCFTLEGGTASVAVWHVERIGPFLGPRSHFAQTLTLYEATGKKLESGEAHLLGEEEVWPKSHTNINSA